MSDEKRRKARSDYVYRRMMQSTIAAALGVSEAIVGRWKRAAKDAGDDWDKARTAHVIAGEGVEVVVSTVVEDFMIQPVADLCLSARVYQSPGARNFHRVQRVGRLRWSGLSASLLIFGRLAARSACHCAAMAR